MRNIKKIWLLLFCCTLMIMTQRPVISKAESNEQEETGLDSLSPTDREIFQKIQEKYENFSSKSVTYNQNSKQKFNTNVVGEVVDAESGEKIVNAIICIDDFPVQTDEEGNFQVRNMPNGYYTFTVSKDGYYESVYKYYPISEYNGTDIYKFFISKSQSIEDEYAPFHKDLSTSECVNKAVDELEEIEETLIIEDDTNDYNTNDYNTLASLNSNIKMKDIWYVLKIVVKYILLFIPM